MWSFFRKWFPFLFPEREKDAPEDKDKGLLIVDEPSDDRSSDDAEDRPARRLDIAGKNLLTLHRTELTSDHSKGHLLWNGQELCYTLEGPTPSPGFPEEGAVLEGDYLVSLRTEGGQHTSYLYRFGDMHQGMLHLEDAPGLPFAYILMGNDAGFSYGNVLLGKGFVGDRLVQSEEAYREVYQAVSAELLRGEEVVLRIEGG